MSFKYKKLLIFSLIFLSSMTKIKAPVENFEIMFQNLKNRDNDYDTKNFLSLELSNDQRRQVILYLIEKLKDYDYQDAHRFLAIIINGDINNEFSNQISSAAIAKLDIDKEELGQRYYFAQTIIIKFPQLKYTVLDKMMRYLEHDFVLNLAIIILHHDTELRHQDNIIKSMESNFFKDSTQDYDIIRCFELLIKYTPIDQHERYVSRLINLLRTTKNSYIAYQITEAISSEASIKERVIFALSENIFINQSLPDNHFSNVLRVLDEIGNDISITKEEILMRIISSESFEIANKTYEQILSVFQINDGDEWPQEIMDFMAQAHRLLQLRPDSDDATINDINVHTRMTGTMPLFVKTITEMTNGKKLLSTLGAKIVLQRKIQEIFKLKKEEEPLNAEKLNKDLTDCERIFKTLTGNKTDPHVKKIFDNLSKIIWLLNNDAVWNDSVGNKVDRWYLWLDTCFVESLHSSGDESIINVSCFAGIWERTANLFGALKKGSEIFSNAQRQGKFTNDFKKIFDAIINEEDDYNITIVEPIASIALKRELNFYVSDEMKKHVLERFLRILAKSDLYLLSNEDLMIISENIKDLANEIFSELFPEEEIETLESTQQEETGIRNSINFQENIDRRILQKKNPTTKIILPAAQTINRVMRGSLARKQTKKLKQRLDQLSRMKRSEPSTNTLINRRSSS